jgi:hypothetical protein
MKKHYPMDQEIEIKINLTLEQFLISETFCCVHTNDRKANYNEAEDARACTQCEIVQYVKLYPVTLQSRGRDFFEGGVL